MAKKVRLKKEQQKSKNQIKPSFNYKLWLSALVVMLVTLVVYIPSINNDFTNWDDPTYVTENSIIRDLKTDNLKEIFTKPISLNYHPLTMLTLALDTKRASKRKINQQTLLSELDAKPYHITNLIIHLLNTLLVFVFIYFLFRKKILPALIVAIFFGIHPMHVESVAWIAERKDVLYSLFFLSGLIVYLKYLEKLQIKYLVFVFVLFLFSCLSKAVAVTLPVLFYAIDYFVGRKFDKRALLEKIPFLIVSIIVGIAAIKIQSGGALAKDGVVTFFQTFVFASYGFVIYIYKLIIPLNLSTFYPYPNLLTNGNLPTFYYFMPALAAIIIGLAIFSLRKTKIVFFGLLFYFVTIALVLQFISVGNAIIADRYSYIPYIGLLLIIAYYFNYLWNSNHKYLKLFKYPITVLLIIGLIWFSYLTRQQIGVWKNTETLWTQVIENYPRADIAFKNRGNYYGGLKQTDKAMKDYEVLMKRGSKDKQIWGNIGNIYRMRNEFDKAFESYDKQVKLTPDDYKSYLNRGIIYGLLKNYELSATDFDYALKLGCPLVKVAQNRAFTYLYGGFYKKAISDFDILIQVTPQESSLYKNRGIAKYNLKEYQNAINDFKIALRYDNADAKLFYNISVCYYKLGDKQNAKQNANKAISLGMQVSESYLNGLR